MFTRPMLVSLVALAGAVAACSASDGRGANDGTSGGPRETGGSDDGGASQASGPGQGDDGGPGASGDDGGSGAKSDAGKLTDAGPAPNHFATLPLGATLPSEAQCTTWILAAATPENMPANTTTNQTLPTSAWLSAFRATPLYGGSAQENAALGTITGNFSGSTDMIIRWAACKWGIDEDVARAEAWEESSWNQALAADSDSVCHSRNLATTALNYWTEASPCKPSKGLYQEKLVYFNGFPYSKTSTPFNADFRMARQRSCMNGDIQYLHGSSSQAFGAYPPTTTDDAFWGCMGDWFSGQWGDSGAVNYVTQLKSILANKPWPK